MQCITVPARRLSHDDLRHERTPTWVRGLRVLRHR